MNRKLLAASIGVFFLRCMAFGDGGSTSSETQAWRVVQFKIQQDNSADNTLKTLEEFVHSYPKGERVSRARFAIAETLFQNGQYQKAEPYYQQVVDQRDKMYAQDAMLRLSEIRYNLGDVPGARKSWERVIKKAPSKSLLTAEALYGLALCDLHDDDYLGAKKSLEHLSSTFPGYQVLPRVRELKGIIYLYEKNFKDVVDVLEGINTPAGAFYRGLAYFQKKEYLEAADSFQKLESFHAANFAEMGAFMKAECFRMADNNLLSAKAYDDFLNKFPESSIRAYALVHEARALMKLSRFEEAKKAFAELKTLKMPSKGMKALSLYLGGEIAANLGEYKEAVTDLNASLAMMDKSTPDIYASANIAKAYDLLQLGRSDEAEQLMRKFVTEMPYHPMGAVAFTVLGNAAYSRKDWDTAVSSYESAFLKYQYSQLSDVAMAMMLASYFNAHKYQELVTNSNRIMNVVNSDFSAQDFLWRAHSHMILAEAYYRLKLFPDASHHYEQAMKHPLLAPWARLYLAWSRFHEEKYSEAIRLAQKALEEQRSPESDKASAYILIASSYFNKKSYDAAIDAFQSFRKRFPDDDHVPESFLYEGWAYRQEGYPGNTLSVWDKLVAQHPESTMAQEAQMESGKLFFQARKYKQAAAAFAKVMAKWPKSATASEALWLFAQSYYNDKQDAAAIKAYESFLARYPNDIRAEDARSQLLQARYRQATSTSDPDLIAEFIRVYPKSELAPDAQFQLAQLAHEHKQYPKAIAEYRKLLLDYPGTPQAPLALLTIARIEERLNQVDEAVKEYESLMNLFPTNSVAVDAAMRLGAIYFGREKYPDAAKHFRFVVERDVPEDVKVSAMYNLAVSYKKARFYEEAINAFTQFVSNYPKDQRQMDALLEIANLYKLMEQPQKTVDTYQLVLKRKELAPTLRMEIYNQIGELYQKMESSDKAIEAYSSLLSLEPARQDVRLTGLAQLAALYEEKGDWQNALNVYSNIQRSHGKRQWVEAAAKRMREIKIYMRQQQRAAQEDKSASDSSRQRKPLAGK